MKRPVFRVTLEFAPRTARCCKQILLCDIGGRNVINRRVAGLQHAITGRRIGNRLTVEDHAQAGAGFFQPRRARVIPDRFLSGRWFRALGWEHLYRLSLSHRTIIGNVTAMPHANKAALASAPGSG